MGVSFSVSRLKTKNTSNIPSGQFLHLRFMMIFLFVNLKQRGNSLKTAFKTYNTENPFIKIPEHLKY